MYWLLPRKLGDGGREVGDNPTLEKGQLTVRVLGFSTALGDGAHLLLEWVLGIWEQKWLHRLGEKNQSLPRQTAQGGIKRLHKIQMSEQTEGLKDSVFFKLLKNAR